MEKIEIARVLKPQGLKGEVKVKAYSGENSILKEGLTVLLKNGTELFVTKKRMQKGFYYLTFKGLDAIEKVESLRNEGLFVLKNQLDELDKDEYYIADLIGAYVYSKAGEFLGEIKEIENYGAADIYTLKNKNKEVLFAFVEGLFESVDLENKKIIVNDKKLSEVIVWK